MSKHIIIEPAYGRGHCQSTSAAAAHDKSYQFLKDTEGIHKNVYIVICSYINEALKLFSLIMDVPVSLKWISAEAKKFFLIINVIFNTNM